MNSPYDQQGAIMLSILLVIAWSIITCIHFLKNRSKRAYGALLCAAGFAVIMVRNIVGFNYYMTYIGNLLQLAGAVTFINVARFIDLHPGKDDTMIK